MSSKIISFVTERTTMSGTISNKDLLEAYFQYASSTSGRNSLYKHIEQLEGVTRTKSHFNGISLQKTIQKPIESTKVSTQSTYELKCLELKERKLAQQKELKERELAQQKASEIQQKELKERELAQQKASEIQQKELKERELAQQKASEIQRKELKERELALQKELKDMDLAHAYEMKAIDVCEKEKDRAFMREENNKNRRMHMPIRHNKYLDFAVYGNPSSQYIERSSMVDVLGFQAFNVSNKYDSIVLDAIESESRTVSKSVCVYENASVKEIDCIDVTDAKKVLENVSKAIDSPNMLDLMNNLESIPSTAVSDECRTIPSRYVSKKNIQDKSIHGKSKHKLKYVKAVNKLRESGGKVLISCACCGLELDLQSSGCHRAHDIPQSDGGDWSIDNVYLTCASCNATMSDHMSVVEYKVELYVKVLENESVE
jgi:hypothetical protein